MMDASAYQMSFDKEQLALLCANYDRCIDSLDAESKRLKAENAKLRELCMDLHILCYPQSYEWEVADHTYEKYSPCWGRATRSEAKAMLRAGAPPEKVAAHLGVPVRKVRRLRIEEDR